MRFGSLLMTIALAWGCLLIWGTRGTESLTHGFFNCPHCLDKRTYMHRVVRRWFHIFWIPLIPLEKSEYVACTVCNEAYEPTVLVLSSYVDKYLNESR